MSTFSTLSLQPLIISLMVWDCLFTISYFLVLYFSYAFAFGFLLKNAITIIKMNTFEKFKLLFPRSDILWLVVYTRSPLLLISTTTLCRLRLTIQLDNCVRLSVILLLIWMLEVQLIWRIEKVYLMDKRVSMNFLTGWNWILKRVLPVKAGALRVMLYQQIEDK